MTKLCKTCLTELVEVTSGSLSAGTEHNRWNHANIPDMHCPAYRQFVAEATHGDSPFRGIAPDVYNTRADYWLPEFYTPNSAAHLPTGRVIPRGR